MNSTFLKLTFIAVFATVAGLATLAEAAIVGPDFNNVGFTYKNKKRGFEGMLRVRNASEATEIAAFETLFDTSDIVIWDKVERGHDSKFDRIELDLDHGRKSGVWSLEAEHGVPDFDTGNIVGFAVKAGTYTGYFKFDTAGLALDTMVAFNSLADYAGDLFGDLQGYKDKYFRKAVSHLTVFGSAAPANLNTVAAVPLPPSVSMLGLALLGFGVLSWRRKRVLAV